VDDAVGFEIIDGGLNLALGEVSLPGQIRRALAGVGQQQVQQLPRVVHTEGLWRLVKGFSRVCGYSSSSGVPSACSPSVGPYGPPSISTRRVVS